MTNEGDREARVRDAVIAFVENGERPDRHRLAVIEQRLLAQRRRGGAPWWWVVLGIGLVSGAAASYWAVTREEAIEPVPVEEKHATDAEQGAAQRDDADGAGDETEQAQEQTGDESPVIYIGQ